MSTPLLLPPADLIDTIGTYVAAYHWVILAFVFHLTVLGAVAYLILLERKTASWVQDRIGPNRVGFNFGLPFMPKFHFWGLGQPLADGLKFLVKEDYGRKGVDRILFSLAPIVMIIVVIISIAVIPWGGVREVTKTITVDSSRLDAAAFAETAALDGRLGEQAERAIRHYLPYDAEFVTPIDLAAAQSQATFDNNGNVNGYRVPVHYRYHFQIANLNIGILFVLAVLSLAVYGVVIGGWASDNKYSFLGGLRATANMISYEIPLGMSALIVVIMFGTLDLALLVDRQADYWFGVIPAWNMFAQPLAFLLFLVCIHAEANRAPFDMAEAEQELVGGYHTEYSSMRFALFFLAEYAGMVTTALVLAALFWGGWHVPYLDWVIQGIFQTRPEGAPASVTTSLIECIFRSGVIFGKAVLVLFIFMWVRWSLPRFRFDQLMQIAWKGLIPIMLVLIVSTTLLVYYFGVTGRPTVDGLDGVHAVAFLGLNVVVTAIIVIGSFVIPAGANQNARVAVPGSRFRRTPLPLGVSRRPMRNEQDGNGLSGVGTGSNTGLAAGHGGLVSYSPDEPKV
ncbi:MAG: complex I subunit 1 family protein [Planctomycetota bacterium]